MTIYLGENYFENSKFPFYIDRCPIGENQIIPAHIHDFIELVYVISGNAIHEMSGNRYEIKSGDVFVIEPQIAHSYFGDGHEKSLVFNVLFNLELLGPEMRALQRLPAFIDFFYLAPFLRKDAGFIPYLHLEPLQMVQLEANLEAIFREYGEKSDGYQLVIKTRLLECLVLLSRFHHENEGRLSIETEDGARIQAIARFIEQHYDQPVTLSDLSRACGMSISSFTAKFKSVTGMTLLDYKHTVQIRKACALLENKQKKVLDVAHEVGFCDISFFNKLFKKYMGITPREFRSHSHLDNPLL